MGSHKGHAGGICTSQSQRMKRKWSVPIESVQAGRERDGETESHDTEVPASHDDYI